PRSVRARGRPGQVPASASAASWWSSQRSSRPPSEPPRSAGLLEDGEAVLVADREATAHRDLQERLVGEEPDAGAGPLDGEPGVAVGDLRAEPRHALDEQAPRPDDEDRVAGR